MKRNLRILACSAAAQMLGEAAGRHTFEAEYFPEGCGDVLERIAGVQPDAVILELFAPRFDAVELIRAYRTLYADYFTYFAVICPIISDGLKRELAECGADRLVMLPCGTRDIDEMMSDLNRMMTSSPVLKRSAGIHAVHRVHHIRRVSEDFTPENAVEDVLEGLGIRRGGKGFTYLRMAVVIALGEDGPVSVTKDIYPSVAKEYGTTPSCVERHIRSAIDEAWKSRRNAMLPVYFGNTVDNMRGKPSNGEFIAMLADRIRLDISYAKNKDSGKPKISESDLRVM